MQKGPTISVRAMRADDARQFLVVHREAVREIAAKEYPPEIINEWAPMPISAEAVESVIATQDQEVRVVAEMDTKIVGIAAVVPERNELRACYVLPRVARNGVGTALVCSIEEIAKQRGL